MGKVNRYLLEKLSGVNYNMAVHEGDANHRLASEAENIVLFTSADVPTEYRRAFDKMKKVLNETVNSVPFPFVPTKIRNIRNVTAAKYIALLISIEHSLHNQAEDEDQSRR